MSADRTHPDSSPVELPPLPSLPSRSMTDLTEVIE